MKTTDTFEFRQIGVVHSPFQIGEEVRKSDKSKNLCEIEVFPEFSEGLADIEGFSHIVIVFVLHRAEYRGPKVTPIYHPETERGVFATLHPARPNPIGITICELLAIEGNVLKIRGIDMFDGSPVIDIKPYTKSYCKEITKFGWMGEKYPNAETD